LHSVSIQMKRCVTNT